MLVLLSSTLVVAQAPTAEYSVDANTVALYHFNETSGDTTYDETDNNNDGSLRGGATWDASGKFGGCVSMSDTFDYVNIADSVARRDTAGFYGVDRFTSYTVDAWVYVSSNYFINADSTTMTFILNNESADGKLAVLIDTMIYGDDGDLHFHARQFATTGLYFAPDPDPIVFDQWYHVRSTWNGSDSLCIWVDGTLKGVNDSLTDMPNNTGMWSMPLGTTIGFNNYALYNLMWFEEGAMRGKIDEMRISDINRHGGNPYVINPVFNGRKAVNDVIVSYPNPFMTTASILYKSTENEKVRVNVYDLKGRHVKTIFSGQHSGQPVRFVWNGENFRGATVANGQYLVKVESESGKTTAQKVVFGN